MTPTEYAARLRKYGKSGNPKPSLRRKIVSLYNDSAWFRLAFILCTCVVIPQAALFVAIPLVGDSWTAAIFYVSLVIVYAVAIAVYLIPSDDF